MEPHRYSHLNFQYQDISIKYLDPFYLSLYSYLCTLYFLKAYQKKKIINNQKASRKKVHGQLVLLSFDITAFTLAAYRRPSLERPLREISS